ncbi:MAG TPA: hypothetical protein DCS66_04935, partial [Flavobacteriaceae bacterium]|nr:hypothetical protein [Flavobacteriaceae bacterium]
IEDVKLFIEWCKEDKVKSFKFDNIQFELSELSFIENVEDYTEKLQTDLDESKFEADQQKQDDDELMFWSSST